MRSADIPSENGDVKAKQVAVIGAGTVGSCCAWYLQRAGFEVTVIDPVLPGQSTSYGNAGCIAPSHISPFSYPGVMRPIPGWLLDPGGPLRIRWAHFPGLVPWLWRFWRSGTAQGVEWSSQALARLMSDPALRKQLGAAGRARVERHFTWRTIAARTAEVLEAEVAGGPRP